MRLFILLLLLFHLLHAHDTAFPHSLMFYTHTANALIHSLAYVNDVHTHIQSRSRPITSDNDFDVKFNRSFSGYGITIHQDNTQTHTHRETQREYYWFYTSYKMHSQNAFLLCINTFCSSLFNASTLQFRCKNRQFDFIIGTQRKSIVSFFFRLLLIHRSV